LNHQVRWPVKPIALFGGTFDPVHYGHLRCAEELRLKLGLDSLFLLPAGYPAHRAQPQASTDQRLDMLRLAQVEFPALELELCEVNRDGPSYMVETLQGICSLSPDTPLLLLIGQDAANKLNCWHRWQELFSLAHIIILTRPGATVDYSPELASYIETRRVEDVESLTAFQAGSVLQIQVTAIDICATTIKSMIRLGRSPQSMLPPGVMSYINDNGLYQSSPDGVQGE